MTSRWATVTLCETGLPGQQYKCQSGQFGRCSCACASAAPQCRTWIAAGYREAGEPAADTRFMTVTAYCDSVCLCSQYRNPWNQARIGEATQQACIVREGSIARVPGTKVLAQQGASMSALSFIASRSGSMVSAWAQADCWRTWTH